ncbi:hypothetical protein STEG23_028903 [Scotinomys teguina]
MDINTDMVPEAMDISTDMVPEAMDINTDMVPEAMDINTDMVPEAMDINTDMVPGSISDWDVIMSSSSSTSYSDQCDSGNGTTLGHQNGHKG